MGGHFGGDVASRAVSDAFMAYWQEHDEPDSCEKVINAAKAASTALDGQSGLSEMGTTLVMASVEGNQATIGHAGDSRCYVIDIKGYVKYRTIDHVDSNPFGHSEITRAFFTGHPESAIPEVKTVQLEPLDRILLCTDGLYNAIDDEILLHTLQCAKDVDQVAEKYKLICREKATDNYSAIIIEID
jgi:protein phosphatase